MTQDEIAAFVTGLPGAVVVTASEANGAPEVAWGDSFFFYDPGGDEPADRRMPFATIVTNDYDGFDTASELSRAGVFRLNIGVGRAVFEELLGYPPTAHAERSAGTDYTALDRLIPHPVYATQAWVSILNPGDATAGLARSLLTGAHIRAAGRHRRHA
jgi:Family of unknown function (DUF6194)